MEFPAVCCRGCGTEVLPLARVAVHTFGIRKSHLVAAEPSKHNQSVRVTNHHSPESIELGKGVVAEKLRKVYCRVCSNNLGNVQRTIKNGNER